VILSCLFGFVFQELEDMLLRYERQLKAEIQARQAAETAAAEALSAMGQGSGGHQRSPDWHNQQEQLQQVSTGTADVLR
jgi:hypothetical protein